MGQTHSVSKNIKTEEDVVEELNLSYQNLTVLPPLHSGLKVLYCQGNQLTVLPPLPSGLKKLICWDNKLTELPPLPSGLKKLRCCSNKLTELPPLPSGLKNLNCYTNRLTALPLLPSGLETLYCYSNPLEYKGTTIEEIRKEQEERKNIWMTNMIVYGKIKQEMGLCKETKLDWLVKNIISHF